MVLQEEEVHRGHQTGSAHQEGDESRFRLLLEKLPVGAYTCDPAGLITYYNRHAARLWGRAPRLNDPDERFCGSFRLFALDGSPIAHDRCWMALALKTNEGYNEREIVVERPDGSRLTALAHANPIRDESGELLGAVNVLVDITERKRAEEELERRVAERTADLAAANDELRSQIAERRALERRLEHQATHDPLTDLPNRTSFYENLGRALARARRRGSKVALLFVDLDDFKSVNDSMGHQAGDRVLREVAQRLKGCLREADTAARLGGDEFAVLMEDVAEAGQAVSLAERCAERMGVTVKLDGKLLFTTASIGIAIGIDADPEGLVRAADLAMYRAKSNGETYSVISEPSEREAREL